MSEPNRPAALLEVSRLSKSYALYRSPAHRLAHALAGRLAGLPTQYHALRDVSFELARGDALAVVGRNGAGKSTLLQIVSGVLEPSAGSVRRPPRTAGLLELGSGFNPEFTGRENVYLNASILGLTRRQVAERMDEIVEFADIGDFIDQPVKTYSSGMFLRLAFSVAISVEPDLVLVDEALTVGDVFFQQKCYARLDALRAKGMGMLLVTHSMADAAEFCNRGLVLSGGAVAYEGSGKEAVEYYFHHERETPTGRQRAPVTRMPGAATGTHAPADQPPPAVWRDLPETVDLRGAEQFGSGEARAVRLLVTDLHDHPMRVFAQGEWMRLHMEFEVGAPVAAPLIGMQLMNQRGFMVHGKSSLQFDQPGASVPPGSILSCMQEVRLDVDVGEYTLEIGLAQLDPALFEQRDRRYPQELAPHIHQLCHLSGVAALSIVHRNYGSPCLWTHYGACDLPGRQVVQVWAGGAEPAAGIESGAHHRAISA